MIFLLFIFSFLRNQQTQNILILTPPHHMPPVPLCDWEKKEEVAVYAKKEGALPVEVVFSLSKEVVLQAVEVASISGRHAEELGSWEVEEEAELV